MVIRSEKEYTCSNKRWEVVTMGDKSPRNKEKKKKKADKKVVVVQKAVLIEPENKLKK